MKDSHNQENPCKSLAVAKLHVAVVHVCSGPAVTW